MPLYQSGESTAVYHVLEIYCTIMIFNIFSVALYIHDPVYRLRSPGKYLHTVETWNEGLEKLGGENTAYWPNQIVQVPAEVRFIFMIFHVGGHVCLLGSFYLKQYSHKDLKR